VVGVTGKTLDFTFQDPALRTGPAIITAHNGE
jgi:hypothetical protein